MKQVACLLILLISVVACRTYASRPPREFYISEGSRAFLLPPIAFREELTSLQEITTTFNGADRVLTGVLKLSPESMQVIILADMARIMTVNYTSVGIQCDFSPLIPASNIEPEYVLFDVQLIYFPVEKINEILPHGMSLKEEGSKRVLYRGAHVITEIVRDGDSVELNNFERTYSYKIKQLEN